jgi:hypothetical protein
MVSVRGRRLAERVTDVGDQTRPKLVLVLEGLVDVSDLSFAP